jgi:predicted GTPase
MPNDKKTPKRVQWNEITYVIDNLTAKDLAIVDDMDVSIEHVNNFISEQIESGADFKVKYDYAYGDCPSVSMVYYTDGNDNTGFGISARGRDFTHCMQIIMYKFFEVAHGKLYELSEVKRSTRYG